MFKPFRNMLRRQLRKSIDIYTMPFTDFNEIAHDHSYLMQGYYPPYDASRGIPRCKDICYRYCTYHTMSKVSKDISHNFLYDHGHLKEKIPKIPVGE